MKKDRQPLSYFIDKHTLAIKELSDLFFQMKQLLGEQVEATHTWERKNQSADSPQRQQL